MTVYAEWWWRGVPKEKDKKNMSDYISREKAIDTADDMRKRCDTESIDDYHDLMVESLSVLPSADVPHWIPCSEQMPPMDKYVLVCTVDGNITDGQRWDEDDDGAWFIFGDSCNASDGDIVAWMPLPEPYKDGEQDAV